jgi:hypothetical protein
MVSEVMHVQAYVQSGSYKLGGPSNPALVATSQVRSLYTFPQHSPYKMGDQKPTPKTTDPKDPYVITTLTAKEVITATLHMDYDGLT